MRVLLFCGLAALCLLLEGCGSGTVPASSASTSAPAKSYLGLVATNTEVATFRDTGSTWLSTRSFHYARTDIAAGTLRVVWGNYFAALATNVETDPGAATFKAAVEYPAGTIYPCTFNSAATATIAGLTDAVTDGCGPAIPNGARFFVRVLYVNSKGVLDVGGQPGYYAADEGLANGSGTPVDLVNSGTYPVLGSNVGFRPLAIVAPTTRASVCIAGDSRATGSEDYITDAAGDIGEIARSVGPSLAYAKLAVTGSTGASALANFSNRLRIVSYCSHVIDEYGLNDMGFGPLSAVVSTRTALAAMFGKPTWGTTLPPVTYSIDNWSTTAGQTQRTDTRPFNALVRQGIAGEAGYFDVAHGIDPRESGLWPVAADLSATVGTPYYSTPEGLHENPTGNVIIHASGVVDPSKLILK